MPLSPWDSFFFIVQSEALTRDKHGGNFLDYWLEFVLIFFHEAEFTFSVAILHKVSISTSFFSALCKKRCIFLPWKDIKDIFLITKNKSLG